MSSINTRIAATSPTISPTSPTAKKNASKEPAHLYFSLALLEPATQTIDTLLAAVQQFEEYIDATTMSVIVTRALNMEKVFEYAMSAISEPTFATISSWLLSQFPPSANLFLEPSVSVQCVSQLAKLFASRDAVVALDTDSLLATASEALLAPAAIQALVKAAGDDADVTSPLSPSTSPKFKKRRMSKAVERSAFFIEEAPLKNLNLPIPTSSKEAHTLAQNLLSDQRNALRDMLALVRHPALRSKLRDDYLIFGPNSDTAGSSARPMLGSAQEALGSDPGEFGDLRAYLTYASPKHFGKWRILLTGRASKDLEAMNKGGSKLYPIILQKLCDLSRGIFSQVNQKRISNSSPVDIFEARLPGNPRLVYQVDCVRETKNDTPKQVLLVYGVYDHKGVARIPWEKYGKQQARRGAEYIDACRYRSTPRLAGNDVFEPGEFPNMTATLDMVHSLEEDEEEGEASMSKAEIRELHSLLVLGRHAFLSQNFLDGLLQEEGVAQIHQLSLREREVVEHTDSCFVLGRSGTGKTTTILFKIFGIERAWEHLGHSHSARPRQMFVTKSSLLAKKVEQEFVSFLKYDIMAENAPAHFVQRAARVEDSDPEALFTNEHLGIWRGDIPSRYSQLTDEHFPLFVTYDELCTMIENDFKAQDEENISADSTPWSRRSRYASGDLVTSNAFKEKYWPRFPNDLKNQTVPAVALGVFVGTIKGSEQTIDSADAKLNRAQYEQLQNRHVDYSHFEAYSRIKAERGERDAADRAHTMRRELDARGLPGRKIDFLYVDEVQDNILVEIALLRELCRNPNGLFWAGDTAQTISHGSAFRFTELTGFLHRREHAALAAQYKRAFVKPEFFQLSINYRSPGGIVNCARSIIDLLERFPGSIDHLEPEEGIIEGLRPLFLQYTGSDVANDFFMLEQGSGRARVGLGPNQCILVRDEAARQRLRVDMGLKSVGTILSIYNSKGLEYDDIILYDFFEDSSVKTNLWRHLLDAHSQVDLEDRRHSPLAVELKHLYVAITRARRNLWIVDTSDERCMPMKNFWSERGLVEIASQELTLSGFADASASKDWLRRARDFFQRHIYDEAASAFDRAGDERRSRLAGAFYAKQQAGEVHEKRRRRDALEASANGLIKCAEEAPEEKEIRGIYTAVADVYVELKDHQRAADAFEQARNWSKAAEHYFKAGLLDKAVAVVTDNKRSDVESSIRSKIVSTAKCAYLEDAKARIEDAKRLFEAEGGEDISQFIEDNDFTAARAVLLEARQDFVEAANVLFRDGDVVGAVTLLVDNASQDVCANHACTLGLQYLRAHFSLASHAIPGRDDSIAIEILKLLAPLFARGLTTDQRREVKLFEAITFSETSVLESLATESCAREGDASFGMLCLDAYLRDLTLVQIDDQHALLQFVGLFGFYVRTMRALIMRPTLDRALFDSCLLLGLRRVEDDPNYVDLGEDTFLADAYRQRHGSQISLRVTCAVALDLKRRVLSDYLAKRVQTEVEEVRRWSRIFEPCWQQSIIGRCKPNTRHPHPVEHNLNRNWFNRRIQFHIEQIDIMHHGQALPFVDDYVDRIKQRREWLGRLENAFNPLLYVNGSQSQFTPSKIPHLDFKLSVVKQWSLDVLYRLNPTREERRDAFLTHFLVASKIGLRVDARMGGSELQRALPVLPCTRRSRRAHPDLFIGLPYRSPYTIPFLVEFLRGSGNVRDGVNFLELIVDRRVPLDFGTLCDFADRLTGLFILTRSNEIQGMLHNVTLPRSWIAELWPEFMRCAGRNSAHGPRLVGALARLLRDVYHENVSLNRVWDITRARDLPNDVPRDVCMARICRDLCLMGYNFQNSFLRDGLTRDITGLRFSDAVPGFTPLSRRYLFANNWADLASAVSSSCALHISDEMIHVCASSRPPAPTLMPHLIRKVTYRRVDDLPGLLQFRDTRLPMPPPSFAAVPTAPAQRTPDVAQDFQESHEFSGSTEAFGYGGVGSQTETHIEDSVDEALDQQQQHLDEAEEAQDSYVRTIQRAWHRHCVPPDGALASARHHRIREHRRASSSKSMTPTYRAVFIVHLPRLLLCLEHSLARARSDLGQCKQERKWAAKNHELDKHVELMDRVKALMAIEKRAESLHSILLPASTMHGQVDALSNLKHHAHEVQAIVSALPHDTAISAELTLALRGIMNAGQYGHTKGQTRKTVRPTLNTRDL